MARRRLHHPNLSPGQTPLAPGPAHHARDVLRLAVGDELELFDDAGQTALAVIRSVDPSAVVVSIESVAEPRRSGVRLTIASAIPKAQRADWMVEKLAEFGVARLVPLATARSVVHPEGKNKLDRWVRIATEAARQSHAPGVMEIDELTPLPRLLQQGVRGAFLSTRPHGVSIGQFLVRVGAGSVTLLVGPEGGWADAEIDAMTAAGLTPVSLGPTILRIETAAIAAAAIAAASQLSTSQE